MGVTVFQKQVGPYGVMIAGAMDLAYLPGRGPGQPQSSNKDVIPGEDRDRLPHVFGGPAVAPLFEVLPDPFAVEVPGDNHGTPGRGCIGQNRIDLALPVLLG